VEDGVAPECEGFGLGLGEVWAVGADGAVKIVAVVWVEPSLVCSWCGLYPIGRWLFLLGMGGCPEKKPTPLSPNHIPNRYYRHHQRSFNPDAAFQHLFRHTLHAAPQTNPTASPLMAPPSRAQTPPSQTPTGHPTPPMPPSPASYAKPNAS